MAKVFSSPTQKGGESRRVSVRMRPGMVEDLASCMQEQGYSKKEQGAWVGLSIIELSKEEDYWKTVLEDWLDPGKNVTKVFLLEPEAYLALDHIESMVNCNLDSRTELKSMITRTAIIQKILKHELETKSYIEEGVQNV